MTEIEARAWVEERWGEIACAQLDAFGALIREENRRQNLVAPGTLEQMWQRHLTDSAQLLRFTNSDGPWLDVGSGAGFPGIVISILRPDVEVTLVEPRRRRVEFLTASAKSLGLTNVVQMQMRAEQVPARRYGVISARAVASTSVILTITRHLRDRKTLYILPRGRSGATELETADPQWQGLFHVEHSITDASSTILVGSGVA